MSYGFTVVSNGKPGELEISAGYGELPEGTWEVRGHTGAPQTVAGGALFALKSVEVTQKDAAGSIVIDAAGSIVISAQHHETRPI